MGHEIRNTFGINVSCRRYIELTDVGKAQDAVRTLTDADEPLLVVGAGSNMLFTDDFAGTVLHPAMHDMHVTTEASDHVIISCGAGMPWDEFAACNISKGRYGLENLSGIPGDVGSAAVQNIGAYGVEVKDFIREVSAVDLTARTGDIVNIPAADIRYGYRYSRFKDEWRGRYLITGVTFVLPKTFSPHTEYGNIRKVLGDKGISHPTAEEMRQTVLDIRNAKLPDPKVMGNAGSFFMNPVVSREKYLSLLDDCPGMPHYHVDDNHEKIPAAWLIEQCGWKGRSMGNAAVHDKQPLVLVNKGGATGEEIVRLCRAIQTDVSRRFGISLKTEVIII